MKSVLSCLAIAMACSFSASAQVTPPRPYEVTCPLGSVDLQAPTYDPLTNKFRSWLCVDPFGTVTSPVFNVALSTIAVDGVTYPFTATGVQAAITACQNTAGCTAVDARAVQNATLGTLTFSTKAIHLELGSVGQNNITQMILNVPSIVEGQAGQSWLNCTSTTLPCVVLSWAPANMPGGGIQKLRLIGPGPGTTSKGISLAATSCCLEALIDSVDVETFGTGVSLDTADPASFTTFRHSHLFGNGKNLNIPGTVTSLEKFVFDDSAILSSNTWANGVTISASVDFQFIGGSIDYTQVVLNGSNAHFRMFGTHTENSFAVAGAGNVPFILTSGTMECVACDVAFFQTGAATNASYFTNNGGDLHIVGGKMNSIGGVVGSVPVVNATTGNNWIAPSPTLVAWASMYTGSGASVLNPSVAGINPNTSFTTTAAASDNVTVTGMTASGHCYLEPTNAGAAGGIASVFVSAKAAGQITVTHTATAGWTFDVICSSN